VSCLSFVASTGAIVHQCEQHDSRLCRCLNEQLVKVVNVMNALLFVQVSMSSGILVHTSSVRPWSAIMEAICAMGLL